MALRELLKENPKTGTPLGKDSFTIRVAIPSKNRGKSGGARIITHLKVIDQKVYLPSIYDKSEQDSMADAMLDDWIKNLPE